MRIGNLQAAVLGAMVTLIALAAGAVCVDVGTANEDARITSSCDATGAFAIPESETQARQLYVCSKREVP